MNTRRENFYIITGGPGVGKTTLINYLKTRGIGVVEEVARKIIRQQVDSNEDGLPWKNKERYLHLMIEESLKCYDRMVERNAPICFFDRGIVDALCYAKIIGVEISPEMDRMAKDCQYNQKVFILPPWKDIYQTDQERKQSWEEAVYTYDRMKEVYLHYGYEVVDVPIDTVENRAHFLLKHLKMEDIS